jgi:hypothetical protein
MPRPLPGLNTGRVRHPRPKSPVRRELPRTPPRRSTGQFARAVARDLPATLSSRAGVGTSNGARVPGQGKSQRGPTLRGARSSPPLETATATDPRTLARLAKKIKTDGLARVDGRIHAVRVIRKWQKALVADLGGPAALTTAQQTLVELSTRTRLVLEHLDAYLLTKKSLIIKRQGKLIPMVMDRMKVSDTLTRQLLALGLDRKTKTIPALAHYVQDTYASPVSRDPVPEGKGPKL